LRVRVGVLYGLGAYLAWGLVPVYFKAVAQVPALEVLAHRVVWSVVLLGVLMGIQGRWREAAVVLRNRSTMLTLACSTALIATNWLTFIWAISHGRVLQASLGYFINPLVNVLLGFLFLRERLRGWQKVSVLLAAAGVAYLTISFGRVPWIALVLATSFGLYGLLRKTVPVDAMAGLTLETALLGPAALAFLLVQAARGAAFFPGHSWQMNVLLPLSGVVTAVPLLWFVNGARRLRLSTMGFLQYVSPTEQFLLAVLAFGEPFGHVQQVSFACIWTALAIYTADTVLRTRASVVRP
jgi:chloramphenicol-sensitive protein RarD